MTENPYRPPESDIKPPIQTEPADIAGLASL